MSLLMEALRRAEQAKQDALSRSQELNSAAPNDISETENREQISVEELEQQLPPVSAETLEEKTIDETAEINKESLSLCLEEEEISSQQTLADKSDHPSLVEMIELGIETREETPSSPAEIEIMEETPPEISAEKETLSEKDEIPAEPFHGKILAEKPQPEKPKAKPAEEIGKSSGLFLLSEEETPKEVVQPSSLDMTQEESLKEEEILETPLLAEKTVKVHPPAELRSELENDQQKVADMIVNSQPPRHKAWKLWLGYSILLLLLAVVGIGGYSYYEEMVKELTSQRPPPAVSPPPETKPPAGFPGTQKKEAAPPPVKITPPAPLKTEPKTQETPVAAKPQPVPEKKEKPVVAPSRPTQLESGSPPAKPAAKPVPAAGFEVRKMTVFQQLKQQLHEAYTAYQTGNYTQAKTAYQQVLAQDSRNRDALLGLGALAVRAGKKEEAQEYYRQVLRLYPKDAVAEAALLNLDQSLPETESRLKVLVAQTPESAWLHFQLGLLYQRQGRWLEAQQAYFSAYHYENTQAVYAYNLAVSLDQLGKTQAALDFYRRALQLTDGKSAYFDLQAINRRMQALTNRDH